MARPRCQACTGARDLKNKWAVTLTADMWKGVVAEFGLRGWDKVHPCPRYMPAYGAVIGPTPAPAAVVSTDGGGT